MSDRKLSSDASVILHEPPKVMTRAEEFRTCSFSRLIEMALEDLGQAITDPKIEIDMSSWVRYYPSPDPVDPEKYSCTVCMAGAVMCYSYKVASYISWMPQNVLGNQFFQFSKEETDRFQALDAIRCGKLDLAYNFFRGCAEGTLQGMRMDTFHLPEAITSQEGMCCWAHGPELFFASCRSLIGSLREHGL